MRKEGRSEGARAALYGAASVCYTSAFEFESVGASLGEMTLQHIQKFKSTLMRGVFSSAYERSVFACSCVAHACQQLASMPTVHVCL